MAAGECAEGLEPDEDGESAPQPAPAPAPVEDTTTTTTISSVAAAAADIDLNTLASLTEIGARKIHRGRYKDGKIPLRLEVEFAYNGHCEWAYVIDLDKEVLEVYASFDCDVTAEGHGFAAPAETSGGDRDLQPMVASFDFREIFLMLGEKDFWGRIDGNIERIEKGSGREHEEEISETVHENKVEG